jgi:3-isopropylmalate/(R)-2-methylmalate dehydratase large subunit
MGKTLFDKIWDQHVVCEIEKDIAVFYVDRHFIHEVTSPQAFTELEQLGEKVFRPKQIVATTDHNVPTMNQHLPIRDDLSREQVNRLATNCQAHGIELFSLGHHNQGIVHVIGPELGITQPGMSIVCGDSHTSTHGAFGTIAFGIGTSEVAMVLASQCLLQYKPKQMRINIEGTLKKGVTSKDVILYITSRLSTQVGNGYFKEFAGSTISSMSMEARMTMCNMSIEMGARGGMMAPDEITYTYLNGKPYAPKEKEWNNKLAYWKTLYSDADAVFDKEVEINASEIVPMITYGTNPGMSIAINGSIPSFFDIENNTDRESLGKALNYMGFEIGQRLIGMPVHNIFIGSCTNSRIEDFRLAAEVVKGRQKHKDANVLIVPGSRRVAEQMRMEGLDKIFEAAGFAIRQPGCSACLAMNDDKIPAGEYCVSTSNRNFEGRQGIGARTILSSPLTAAASAIAGCITDAREFI